MAKKGCFVAFVTASETEVVSLIQHGDPREEDYHWGDYIHVESDSQIVHIFWRGSKATLRDLQTLLEAYASGNVRHMTG